MTKKSVVFLLILVVIVIILVALGFFFWQKGSFNTSNKNLGAQLFKDNIPEPNPFTKVNPFKGVYQNPFE